MVPTLIGAKVTLRPPRDEDIEARFKLGNDAGILKMYGVSAGDVPEYTRDKAQESIEEIARHATAWIIEANDGPIGAIRLHSLDLRDRRASMAIGLWNRDLLGKGLGTKAISLLLDHALNTLNLHRIGIRR